MLHLLLLLLAATSALTCDPVTKLTITSAKYSEIKVSWVAPTGDSFKCVKGYKICSKDGSCSTVQNSSINEYTITGLEICTKYSVSVVTLADKSAESTKVTVDATTAPGAVSGLGVFRKNDENIVAMWNYNQATAGKCATQFKLSFCDAKGANCAVTNVAVNGSYYMQDLQRKRSCAGYVITLTAIDGTSKVTSDSVSFNGAPDVMGAPENLTVSNINSTSFDLDWKIPEAQAKCDSLVYVNIKSIVHSSGVSHVIAYDPDVTKHSQTNITSCTAYDVSVYFSQADDDNSAKSTVYTLPEGNKVFGGTRVQETSSTSVAVAWNTSLPIDQCIAVYTVCWTKPSGGTAGNCLNATNNKNSHNITGLAADTKYQVSVYALLHTGVKYDNVTLQASTKAGAAGIFHNYLVGVSTLGLALCLLAVSM